MNEQDQVAHAFFPAGLQQYCCNYLIDSSCQPAIANTRHVLSVQGQQLLVLNRCSVARQGEWIATIRAFMPTATQTVTTHVRMLLEVVHLISRLMLQKNFAAAKLHRQTRDGPSIQHRFL